MRCDFDSSMGHTGRPSCYKGEATVRLVVVYNNGESNALNLCDECARAVRRDARSRGYRVTGRRMGGRG